MAKNPAGVVGVTNQSLTKRAGAGNYGSEDSTSRVREPGLSSREPWQGEQRVERSPARPIVRQWATPSYDPFTGRAARVGSDPYAGKRRHDGPKSWDQVPNAGANTTRDTSNTKGRSRPGRW